MFGITVIKSIMTDLTGQIIKKDFWFCSLEHWKVANEYLALNKEINYVKLQ